MAPVRWHKNHVPNHVLIPMFFQYVTEAGTLDCATFVPPRLSVVMLFQ